MKIPSFRAVQFPGIKMKENTRPVHHFSGFSSMKKCFLSVYLSRLLLTAIDGSANEDLNRGKNFFRNLLREEQS
jgi:hypothetical protein